MNQKFKRLLSLMMTMVFVLCMMAAVGVTSYAEGEEKIWYLGWTEGKERYIGWIGNSGEVSVDARNYYKDSEYKYSIKMTKKTTDAAEKYNYCYVEKKVTVEPLTTYRFSAMVKYDELPLEVDSGKKLTGASVTVGSSRSSEVKGDSDWTMVSVVFTTKKDQTECVLRLWNGVYDTERSCNGTAWFSDIKLEKATYTNRYNTLVVILKNVDATVDITGMDTALNESSDGVVRFQKGFTDSDIEAIKETAYGMRDRMNGYAEGRMVYEDIDFVTIDKAITEEELGTYYQGYMINHYSEVVSDILDQNLAKKNYHQIILYSPIQDITNGWVGLGGTKHNGIRFCQSVCGADFSLEYRIRNMCHEILHCIETDSKVINAELTPDFHAHADFGYANGSEEWKDAYIDASLPGGMGIQPEAYMCISGEWKPFIDDDMTSGGLIKQLPTADTVTDRPVIISAVPTAGGALVTWTPVNGAVKYRVFNFTEGVKIRQFGQDTTDTSMEVKGLKGGTEAGIIVLAQLANGKWTSYTDDDIAYVVPDDAVKPYFCANPKENGDVYLIWSSVPTSVRYKIMGREVYADGTRGEWKLLDATRQRCRKTINNLDPDKQYEFLVRGLDKNNKYTPFDASDLVTGAPLS